MLSISTNRFFLFATLLTVLVPNEAVDVYYVTPLPPTEHNCPELVGEVHFCDTLDHYAENTSAYFNDDQNITMIFLEGQHNLTQNFAIKAVYNLSLVFYPINTSNAQVTVHLLHGGFNFHNLVEFRIESLTVRGSSIYDQYHSLQLVYEDVQAEVAIQDVSLLYTNMTVIGHNLKGGMSVTHSVFSSCGLQFSFMNGSNVSVSILNSKLSFETKTNSLYLNGKGSLMYNLVLDDVVIYDLSDSYKPISQYQQVCGKTEICDVCIESSHVNATIDIRNSNFTRTYGTGLCLSFNRSAINVNIIQSTISNHQQGGLVIDVYDVQSSNFVYVTLEDSVIMNNNCSSIWNSLATAGMTISSNNRTSSLGILVKNTSFMNNRDLREQSILIWLFRIINITIVDCEFQGNRGTPIAGYCSEFHFSGNLSFIDNNAKKGGALLFISSHLCIAKNTSIAFQNNFATYVGGVMYIEQRTTNPYLENDDSTDIQCFYEVMDDTEDVSMNFINNSANLGGENIYGISIQSFCIAGRRHTPNIIRSNDIQQIFHFEPDLNSSFSGISSNPTRVCICSSSEHFNCANMKEIFLNVSVCPGEQFSFFAVVVGAQFGTGVGSVYAQFLPPHNACLADSQYSQGIMTYKSCTQLKYKVYSGNAFEIIALTASGSTVEFYSNMDEIEQNIEYYNQNGVIPAGLLTTPVYVNVTLLDCPPGFVLTGDPPSCECYPEFKDSTCYITGGLGYIHRNGTWWIHAYYNGNKTISIIVHEHCPFGYCKPQHIGIDLQNPDSQCAFNRTGTLCGSCDKNYSLALGSFKCLKCPNNNHLTLLLFFAASGILLVLFIKVLNLTVAQGTINGLIFYANIVWAYQSILFPHENHNSGANIFFKTFIAWLNLDLGIETCFIVGLNAYWKTWLQFVFPLYIWSIAIVIIIVSRHSTLMTRLVGNNSVPVLTTLFLLSYSKLLRTVITAMSVTYLVDDLNDSTSIVWSYDGNIAYCGIPHIFLFLTALAVLLLLWLPYTSILLSVQLLKKISHLKFLRWVDKMKPIFDSYFAPFKAKHHYWVGGLLIVRGVLMLTFSLTLSSNPSVNLLSLVIVAGCLLAYTAYIGQLYKKNYLSFLEILSLLNLLLLGGGVLFIEHTDGNKASVVYTSGAVAFLQFVGIIISHLWTMIQQCMNRKREGYENIDRFRGQRVKEQELQTDSDGYITVDHTSTSNESKDFSKLRESLLEDSLM